MAHVVAVANQKGGCGKTTVAMNLGGALGRAGYRVLMVDADPQASAMKWRNNRDEPAVAFEIRPYPYPTLHRDAARWFDGADIVVVDCPPGGARKADNITRSALLIAHLVLVPVRPTPIDYQASEEILPLLQEIALYRPEMRVRIVINGKPPSRTRLGREARAAAAAMFTAEGLDVAVLASELHTRQTYAEAPAAGRTVGDYAPGSKADAEVRALAGEIIECLSQTPAVNAAAF